MLGWVHGAAQPRADQLIEREQACPAVVPRCRVLGVSPSGYWAWRTRDCSARDRTDTQLVAQIRAIPEARRGTLPVNL